MFCGCLVLLRLLAFGFGCLLVDCVFRFCLLRVGIVDGLVVCGSFCFNVGVDELFCWVVSLFGLSICISVGVF